MLAASDFFDLSEFTHRDLFAGSTHVWDGLKNLKAYIAGQSIAPLVHAALKNGVPLADHLVILDGEIMNRRDCEIVFDDATKNKLKVLKQGREMAGASVLMAGSVFMGVNIHIGRGVLIESGALVKEPTIIDDNSEIRQGTYLRGNCLIGKRCVVGHTTEVKHSVFLNDAKAGHFAYLGDSILGNDANLGAGTKMANLRFLSGNVQVRTKEDSIDTGLRKLGAILGDRVQTGCNSVTNPGTLIGSDSLLMPNTTSPSGYHPPKSVIR